MLSLSLDYLSYVQGVCDDLLFFESQFVMSFLFTHFMSWVEIRSIIFNSSACCVVAVGCNL